MALVTRMCVGWGQVLGSLLGEKETKLARQGQELVQLRTQLLQLRAQLALQEAAAAAAEDRFAAAEAARDLTQASLLQVARANTHAPLLAIPRKSSLLQTHPPTHRSLPPRAQAFLL